MKELLLNEDLQSILSFGFGYCRLLVSIRGKAKGCLFLDIDPAFERMTGLKREEVLGKKVSEVFRGKKLGDFDWLSFCEGVVRSGKTQETIQWIEEWGKCYKATLIPSDQETFMVVIQEVSEEIITADPGSRQAKENEEVPELKTLQGENKALLMRLHSMFNLHAAVMLIIEPFSGRIVDANSAACDFYGYSKEELLSLLIEDINILPAEEVERHRLMAYREKQHYFLFPHRLKNGDIRMVDVYSCPIPDGDSKLLYSIIFDVTDREIYRDKFIREKEILRTTLQSIGDGVVTTDNAGMITSLNRVAQDITGWESYEATGRPFAHVFRLQSEEVGGTVEDPIRKVLETGSIAGLTNHTMLINRHGKSIPIADSAAPIRTEEGHIFGAVMVFRDISKDKNQWEQVQYLSYHDPLTGLYNRRYIEESMSQIDAAENLPISVVMGDVNGLKSTNDVFGLEAGDALLRHVAQSLKKNCRKDDLVARWSGDEFIIFMPRTKLTTADEIIRKIINSCNILEESSLGLSLSLGSAVKEKKEYSIQRVIREAEESMYCKKLLNGKSCRSAVLDTLLATLYEKSTETEEHAKRMEAHCHSIGRKLQLSAKEMDELSLLALLHDIGKVGINLGILQKPAPLTPAEWEEMKRHPEIGCRIAKATPGLASVADFILSHHERWDGKGYPQGLKEEEIPLVCRILAVADAFDAMTNDRVYRSAMNKEEAIAELEKYAGTQFDPAIVSLFIQTIKAEKTDA